ncbi:unnamed protein product [Caenorhabditis brenneri]
MEKGSIRDPSSFFPMPHDVNDVERRMSRPIADHLELSKIMNEPRLSRSLMNQRNVTKQKNSRRCTMTMEIAGTFGYDALVG